jgi:hypothetical protein
MLYAFSVGNRLSWEDVFDEKSVKNWPRRVQELPATSAGLSLAEVNSGDIRLDWLVHMGGPLREVFDNYCDAGGQRPGGLELHLSMAPDPVLIFEVQAWLKAHARRGTLFRLSADDAWRSYLVDLNIPVKFEGRFSSDRSSECTNRFLNFLWRGLALSPDQTAELFNASRMQVSESSLAEPPWTACRRLGTWLKFRKEQLRFSAKDIFEIEKRVALVLAFLSPQDEEQEAKSLEARALMLNPTLEVLVRPAAQSGYNLNPLLVVGRYRDSMFEHDLNLVEAAVLEFVRESFRVQEAAVCSAVATELEKNLDRGQQEVYQNLQRLKFEGLILSSDFQQNV